MAVMKFNKKFTLNCLQHELGQDYIKFLEEVKYNWRAECSVLLDSTVTHTVISQEAFLRAKKIQYISTNQDNIIEEWMCNRWTIVAWPGLEPRVFCWPCEHSTFELPSHPVISPTTVHLQPTPVTNAKEFYLLLYLKILDCFL